jgi:Arc-like DNA binding domain
LSDEYKCQYAVTMKTTLRLPDEILDELRRRSREEGRSINATAVEAIRRGLGRPQVPHTAANVLGSFVARPATRELDVEALRRELADIDTRGLEEALEWTREDR